MQAAPPVIINTRSDEMTDTTCYLCGNSGADTRDHVPPKGFLERGNYKGIQRITLPAHARCNQAFSDDEEYVRDLLGPAAELLGLHGVDTILEKSDKSRKREAGFKRRQEFLKNAKVMQLRTTSGIYHGRAVDVPFDRDRLHRVGAKIARGIIYHDAKAVVPHDEVICYGLSVHEVQAEREKELKAGNPYWVQLGWDCCQHDMFAESVAVRRVYIGHPTKPRITIECTMAVILLATFFVVGASFPLPQNAPPEFTFLANTSTGAWIKGENVDEQR